MARIELGLAARADAVEHPLKAIVQVPGHSPTVVLQGTTIGRFFYDHGEALLVLGAPGTGKTTLLLELAQELLDRAERDESQPVPVVLNLSSWAVRRQPLAQWLVAELNERSGVPKRVARQWVEAEQVVPLLDGLDEVAADHRQACVEAINHFRRGHGLLPIAVCSRIADYEALSAKLRLRNAVAVQPLTKSQVQDYIEQSGELMRPLRAALEGDSSFGELLETPLMLWVAMLAYRDAPVQVSREETVEQQRRRLFANFVEAMFKRRSVEDHYTQQQTLDWLSWLASKLTRNKQTVFYLENLHPDWLPTRMQKWLSGAGLVLAIGLISGLIVGLNGWLDSGLKGGLREVLSSALTDGSIGGLTFGLIFGLIGSLVELRPVETMRFDPSGSRRRAPKALRVGLIVGLIFGLIALSDGLISESDVVIGGVRGGLRGALIFGLIFGLSGGLSGGLVTLLATEAVTSRRSPNQGTRNSIRNALSALLICGLFVGPIFEKLMGPSTGMGYALNLWLADMLLFGLIGGLIGGGLFVLRHYVLRLTLWLTRSAPLNYIRFLDYAAERTFLRKVGGGYIFVHRMLLEYFAALSERHKLQDQNTETSSIFSRPAVR